LSQGMTSAQIAQSVPADLQITPPPAVETVPVVTVTMDNIEKFNAVMAAVRSKLGELVEQGVITDMTAKRVLAELEANYFLQLVRVSVQL